MNGFPHRRVGVISSPLFRPFRAGDICDHWTQGVALGYHIWPLWGLAWSGWCIACRTVGAVSVRVVAAMAVRPVAAMAARFVGTMNHPLNAPKGRHVIAQGNALGKVT